jgi:hypothetical protein
MTYEAKEIAMRRITITIGLLAAGLTVVPAADAARPLARAVAEPMAVQQVQRSADNKAAYGLYEVTRTTHSCQRIRARRFACNYALFLRGLIPQATQTLCLGTVAIVRTPAGRISAQQPADVTCA